MAVARACNACERCQTPRFRQVRGNRILSTVYCRMNMIATFQPRRQLRIRTAAPQVHQQYLATANAQDWSVH